MKPQPGVPYPVSIDLGICMEFERLALELVATGREHYSARGILHVMRWHTAIRESNSAFKVNSIHSSILARWFMRKYPQARDFFRTRRLGIERRREFQQLFGQEPDE